MLRARHVLAFSTMLLGLAACADETTSQTDDTDLTSITARSRTLEFVGTVFVDSGASTEAITSAVRTQAQTAFGALRTQNMAVNSRELREIDTASFVKREVQVVDGSSTSKMLEVNYTYKDNAVVDVSYADRTSTPLALMNPSYKTQLDRVIRECTANDEEAREFRSSAWYVFEPKLAGCQDAIRKEQTRIDADRAKLTDRTKQVPKSEVDRLYLPITAKLGADKTNQGNSYPDYQKLYAGGVQKDKLVISFVYGMIDHGEGTAYNEDPGWRELVTMLDETTEGFSVVPGPDQADLSDFTRQKPKFRDLMKAKNLHRDLAERMHEKWITLEKPIKVAIGNEAPRDFAIQFLVYFGAGSSSRPHKLATKNSDVFLYNGHSSIGYGPLDPKNFSASDFPSTYQLLWIDSCVSYNYYEKDYIPLKQGGTKNLDLITNGIESPAWQSGHAMGQFITRLLDGTGASYRDLLIAAEATEPSLRVVDGELDNTYTPATKIRVSPR